MNCLSRVHSDLISVKACAVWLFNVSINLYLNFSCVSLWIARDTSRTSMNLKRNYACSECNRKEGLSLFVIHKSGADPDRLPCCPELSHVFQKDYFVPLKSTVVSTFFTKNSTSQLLSRAVLFCGLPTDKSLWVHWYMYLRCRTLLNSWNSGMKSGQRK